MFQPLFFSFLFDEFSLPPCFHSAFQERVESFMVIANHRKRQSSARYVSGGAFERNVFNLVKGILDVVSRLGLSRIIYLHYAMLYLSIIFNTVNL